MFGCTIEKIITRMTIRKLMNGTSLKLWMFVQNISLCRCSSDTHPSPCFVQFPFIQTKARITYIHYISRNKYTTFPSVWLLMYIFAFYPKSANVHCCPSTYAFFPFGHVCVGANASKWQCILWCIEWMGHLVQPFSLSIMVHFQL